MIEDAELLRRYADEKSEEAFADLVQRHVKFVYACALRRVGGDEHLAEDVTQQVFVALARGAEALARRGVLIGWLYTTARYASANIVRGERRRQAREREVQVINEVFSSSANDAEWQRLRPWLDDVMDSLNENDRQAVLLRYSEGKTFADLGERLRLTENAARMRVERALEKMRALLVHRGVTSTAAALGLVLTNQASIAAPAGLAASVTNAVLAGTMTSSVGWLATFMSISKLQVGIASALAVVCATGYVRQGQSNAKLRREVAALRGQAQASETLRVENHQLANTVAEIELLRRDDIELKRLARSAAEAKKVNEENVQLARTQEKLLESERHTNAELDRMNREGNALVMEYKDLLEKSKDSSLTPEAKTEMQAIAQQKFKAIQAKQREVQTFKKTSQAASTIPQRTESTETGGPHRWVDPFASGRGMPTDGTRHP